MENAVDCLHNSYIMIKPALDFTNRIVTVSCRKNRLQILNYDTMIYCPSVCR